MQRYLDQDLDTDYGDYRRVQLHQVARVLMIISNSVIVTRLYPPFIISSLFTAFLSYQ